MSSPELETVGSDPVPFAPTHPFSETAGADAILRSSDGVDFYVHRVILSLVSPVFETMFGLPQPESSPAIPVIDMQESSAALDLALRFFYPAAQPNVATLEKLQEVLEVVMKYDMQCVVPMVKQHLEKYQSSRPLAVYAIAFRHRWKDVAAAAAKESLKYPLRSLNTEAPAELEGVTAIGYHELLHYHSRCADAARLTTAELKWFPWSTTLDNCRCNKNLLMFSDNMYHHTPAWFCEFLTGMVNTWAITPGANVRDHGIFYVALEKAKCDYCRPFNFIYFVTHQLTAQVRSEIDKVRGTPPFISARI
ncbi:hypothetical protein GGX14DRAFT_365547 [Mycena pura]|uniref:BTB domain-containing protein n=1 Tax=Mycena pura TaxID=153505 RepID=A0AAD6VCI3_9AGAR|nr:hypothetical protein GGX14DRAFT_365547 [Mycena pura]